MTNVRSTPHFGGRPIRALLLDFDGVILQSARIKNEGFGEVYGSEPPAMRRKLVAYAERHGGVTRRDKFAHMERAFLGRDPTSSDLDRLSQRFREHVLARVLAAPFVPGAPELLAAADGKLALHLISGTPSAELVEVVEMRGLRRHFASVLGAPPSKLDTFARLLRENAYRPEDVIAVGDALTEFEAARQLGIDFVGVVAQGDDNPFPAGTPWVPTLEPLPELLGLDARSP